MILIAIGQELMETLLHAYKTNLMNILPPGLWSGVDNCQQTKYIPKIITCGIAHLVKMQMKGRDINNDNVCTKF
jgi:hypothetical protein